ncbi:MAG TPA: prepilin-type N-terminal cleavage/methylation domain-containing protein [Bacillota bacterium]|nr:prepilin-type N-terminal cleavage/methylation domain-containing protein [Bacillota bacterium]
MLKRIAQNLRQVKLNEKGFTLVELIIVIAILGLIMALVIPNVMNSLDSAGESTDELAVQRVQGWVYQWEAMNPGDSFSESKLWDDSGDNKPVINSANDMPVKRDGTRVTVSNSKVVD